MIVRYSTAEPVPTAARAALQLESELVADRRDWWCEALVFYRDPERPGHLVGSMRLLVTAYGALEDYVEVDPVEDRFMASRDLAFLLETFAGWSREHGVAWSVDLGDGTEGRVSAEGADPALRAAVAELAEDAGLDPSDAPALEAFARAVAAAHEGRHR